MSDNDALDFLVGALGKAAKFDQIGDKIVGKVVRYEKRQAKDMESGALKTWEDGSPVWEIVVTLQTDERSDDDDDGLRRLFVRGQMLYAVRDALAQAKWRSDLVGGRLGIKYVSDAEPRRKGWRGAKQFAAKFEPPSPADELEQLADEYGEEPF